MRLDDVMEETFFSISTNRVRSALTILGIVVGIASVIIMVAIGQGAQASITSSISAAGSNLIQVLPGFGSGQGAGRGARGQALTLTIADAQAIAQQVQLPATEFLAARLVGQRLCEDHGVGPTHIHIPRCDNI